MPGIILDPRKRAVGRNAEAKTLAGVILEADMRKVEIGQPVRGIESEDERAVADEEIASQWTLKFILLGARASRPPFLHQLLLDGGRDARAPRRTCAVKPSVPDSGVRRSTPFSTHRATLALMNLATSPRTKSLRVRRT